MTRTQLISRLHIVWIDLKAGRLGMAWSNLWRGFKP